MTELGTTATTTAGPFPVDAAEYVPDLAWPQSVAVFDRMRTDAAVEQAVRGVALPIQKAGWHLDPGDARPEVVDLFARDLGAPILGETEAPRRTRTRGRVQFSDHIREALLALIYGHAAFEQVWEQQADGLMHVTRLASRPAHSITEIQTDARGDLVGIRQYVPGGKGTQPRYVDIPASQLVFYSHAREGAAWQGRSMLRAAYRHWTIKDRLLRIDAQAAERHGVGTPIIEAPEGATAEQIAELSQMAQAYRGGSAAGGALPHGAKLSIVGVSGTLHDTLASIRYQDQQIAATALRTFTTLGTSEHGSRALGETLMDDFILGLQAEAEDLATTINEQLIEPLGDWNWGPDEPLPSITFTPIGSDPELTAEALGALVAAGLVSPDDELEDYVRARFDLPARGAPRPDVTAGGGTPPFSTARPVRASGATPTAAEDTEAGQLLAELQAELSPEVRDALGELIDADQLAADFAASGISDDEDRDNREILAMLVGAWLAAWLWTHPTNRDPLAGTLDRLGTVGYGVAYGYTGTADDIAAAVAAMADTPGLDALHAGNATVAEGIADTRVTAVTDALIDAAAEGLDDETCARLIFEALTDPATAETVAVTETQTGHTVGVDDWLDEAAAAADPWDPDATPGYRYVAEAGACGLCRENAGHNPDPDDDPGPWQGGEAQYLYGELPPHGKPPVHPNCRCLTFPA